MEIADEIRATKKRMGRLDADINALLEMEGKGWEVAVVWARDKHNEFVVLAKKLRAMVKAVKAGNEPSRMRDDEIAAARAVSFSSLMRFEAMGKARNACPNDQEHSVDYLSKANRVKCYPCDKTWDTISWVQATKGMKFQETVRYLNGR
jgi:hypothetical protein